LLLHGQVRFNFDNEGRTAEEVGQQQAEQAVPVAQCLPFAGHGTPLSSTVSGPDCTFREAVSPR
jgi:hypothetical protein